jgi:hypothetical protein
VAVRYKEIMTRPVRVQPMGCGCDETPCEYSRLCDGYEIGLLPRCPDPDQDPRSPDNLADLVKGGLGNCSPCPPSPWVALAEVWLDEDGKIRRIHNCSCRRMVPSFAQARWRCEGGEIEIDSVSVGVGEMVGTEVGQGQTDVSIVVSGADSPPVEDPIDEAPPSPSTPSTGEPAPPRRRTRPRGER